MSFKVTPPSIASQDIDTAKSSKKLRLPTQKESFEQVLAGQLQASVQKNTQPVKPPQETHQAIELQRRSLQFNAVGNGEAMKIEVVDDHSEQVIRKISNQTVDQLIKQGQDYSGSVINTQA